jgi:hypothetical protein
VVGLTPLEVAVGFTPLEVAVGLTPLEVAVGLVPLEVAVGLAPLEVAVGLAPLEVAVGLTPLEVPVRLAPPVPLGTIAITDGSPGVERLVVMAGSAVDVESELELLGEAGAELGTEGRVVSAREEAVDDGSGSRDAVVAGMVKFC